VIYCILFQLSKRKSQQTMPDHDIEIHAKRELSFGMGFGSFQAGIKDKRRMHWKSGKPEVEFFDLTLPDFF